MNKPMTLNESLHEIMKVETKEQAVARAMADIERFKAAARKYNWQKVDGKWVRS